jgi:potassium-transporting ATPase KdpC subunit
VFQQLMPALRSTLVLALYTGIIFPLVITVLGNALFSKQAGGSLIRQDDKVIGSELIGQGFTKPSYFYSRPSAAGSGYAGEASGGTNLGPTSDKLINGDKSFSGVKQLAETFRSDNGLEAVADVPVDAVTRSGSGLDPDITITNAMSQLKRVAKARGLTESVVEELIEQNTARRQFEILGEPRVNVLRLNLALDSVSK